MSSSYTPPTTPTAPHSARNTVAATVAFGTAAFLGTGFVSASPEPTEEVLTRTATLQNLTVRIMVNTLTGPAVLAVFVNGLATPIAIPIPALTPGIFTDLVNTFHVVATDRLSFLMDATAAGAGLIGPIAVSAEY